MSRPLRFLHVTTFYPPFHFGGDAMGIERLVAALARRGHEVEVIHDADAWRILAKRPDPPPLELPPGVTVHRLECRAPRLSCLLTQQSGRPIVHVARMRCRNAARACSSTGPGSIMAAEPKRPGEPTRHAGGGRRPA